MGRGVEVGEGAPPYHHQILCWLSVWSQQCAAGGSSLRLRKETLAPGEVPDAAIAWWCNSGSMRCIENGRRRNVSASCRRVHCCGHAGASARRCYPARGSAPGCAPLRARLSSAIRSPSPLACTRACTHAHEHACTHGLGASALLLLSRSLLLEWRWWR